MAATFFCTNSASSADDAVVRLASDTAGLHSAKAPLELPPELVEVLLELEELLDELLELEAELELLEELLELEVLEVWPPPHAPSISAAIIMGNCRVMVDSLESYCCCR